MPSAHARRPVPNNDRFHGLDELEPRQLLSAVYVATWGSDANNGSIGSPYATLEKAAFNVSAGDTIYLRGGTYYWTNDQWVSSNGTASQRITIDNYGNEQVILDGSNNQGTATFGQQDVVTIAGSYITFRDIEVRDSKANGIAFVAGADNVVIDNVKAHHSQYAGVAVLGNPWNIWETNNITVKNSDIYRNAQANNPTPANGQGAWPGAMISHWSSYVNFMDNNVYENYGEGILQVVSHGGYVQGNTVRDNYSHNIYLDNATSTTVRNNLVHTYNLNEFKRDGWAANGIAVANENYVVTRDSKDNTIVNNIVIGGVHGFYYGNYDRGGGLINTLVAHNVFHNSDFEVVKIDYDNGHSGALFVNNIFSNYRYSGNLASYAGGGWIDRHHNGYAGGNWQTNNFYGYSDVWAHPDYANAWGNSASDYRIKNTSPMVNAGQAGQYSTDYWWSTRDSTPNLGAFESTW
ncbi:MAG: right-handed parallel beta-helix repeat-containing protein [Planctomycetota bacterium]